MATSRELLSSPKPSFSIAVSRYACSYPKVSGPAGRLPQFLRLPTDDVLRKVSVESITGFSLNRPGSKKHRMRGHFLTGDQALEARAVTRSAPQRDQALLGQLAHRVGGYSRVLPESLTP